MMRHTVFFGLRLNQSQFSNQAYSHSMFGLCAKTCSKTSGSEKRGGAIQSF